MKRLYKKHKLSFLGITISVSIRYSPKKAFEYSKILTPSYFIFLAIAATFFFKNALFNNLVYATESTPLLEKISPYLVQYDENNVPPQPKVNDSVVFHGPRDTKEIALTFDADMTPFMKSFLKHGDVASYYNKKVIDILNATRTPATLFLTGMWIETYPDVTRELATDSLFELGNHSYSHPGFDGYCFGLPPLSESNNFEEIAKTQKLLKDIGKVDNKIFRFPGGCYSNKNLIYVKKEGLDVVHWDVAGQDGFNNNTTTIIKNVIDHVQNGSIIVLHMNGYPNSPKTADALPKIISTLKDKGYTFVKVSELIKPKSIQAVNIRDFLTQRYGL